MKHTFYTLLMCVAGTTGFSQITLTQNDIAPVGTRIAITIDANPLSVSAGNAGPNGNWTFTNLGTTMLDTFDFVNPANTPYGTNYQTANLAMVSTTAVYGYAELNSSSFRMIGQEDANSAGMYTFKYLIPETILQFPFTYQNSFNDQSKTVMQMYLGFDPGIGQVVDSVRIISDINKTVLADAWGSCTTSFGTYNVVRLNTVSRETQNTEFQINGTWVSAGPAASDSSRTYSFWANSIGTPLVELTEDMSTGQITEVQWVTGLNSTVGITEQPANMDLIAFPNPANTEVQISTEMEEYTVELIDLNGRTVFSETGRGNRYVLNTSAAEAGQYFIRLTDKTTGISGWQKLSIVH